MATLKTALVAALLLASCAAAAPLCTHVVTNAAEFQALGNGGCQFGDKIFYGFTYSYTLQDANGDALTANVPATAVTVQFSNLGNLVYQPVLSFISTWDVTNGEQGDIRIDYSVSAPLSAAMYSSTLQLTGKVSNVDPYHQFGSYISGAESVCCPGPGSSVVSFNGVELDPPPTATAGVVSRTGMERVTYRPATQISLSKDIYLSSGGVYEPAGALANENEATLTRIDEGLVELNGVPEPVSFLLFGSGLISMVLLTKRMGKLNNGRRTS